jgi:transcriptional regulator with PAS, ATPase and Fis domain
MTNLLGTSSQHETLVGQIACAARASKATVLVQGETGTGKELVAQAIHAQSARAGAKLVAVNCGAIPPTLIEAELFGAEKGAYTGATATRHGWFEAANKGTLFLDEVGELPLLAQTQLLRVLQEGKIMRIGGSTEIAVDVRIIAATNRDLAAEVAAGRFRADLYYRLARVVINIEPLRARIGDLDVLVPELLARAAHDNGFDVPVITDSAWAQLKAHVWPGNVRELHATLERTLVTNCENNTIVDINFLHVHKPAFVPAAGAVAHVGRVKWDTKWFDEQHGMSCYWHGTCKSCCPISTAKSEEEALKRRNTFVAGRCRRRKYANVVNNETAKIGVMAVAGSTNHYEGGPDRHAEGARQDGAQ